MISLLDYGAGNVRSVINAIESLGETVRTVRAGEDILKAERLVFPGVGAFGNMMQILSERGFLPPLAQYLAQNRPFLGICLGLHALFEESEEAPGVKGLGILPGRVVRFKVDLAVPHIGWNGISIKRPAPIFRGMAGDEKFYFVHSYHVAPADDSAVLATTDYGYPFVSAVRLGNLVATQFHPEKSGPAGLRLLKNFISADKPAESGGLPPSVSSAAESGGLAPSVSSAAESGGLPPSFSSVADPAAERIPEKTPETTRLAKRVIACLDVRANDRGDLVVTKGDQYDVREKGAVRNLGRPVDLARRYYEEGADEIAFLNITGFRDFPMEDMPMLEVLRRTSENVFVPLTIGGGIRSFTDRNGRHYSALEVAAEYFRSGADKISIGSDAVRVVSDYLATGRKTGTSAIETIARVYGSQAVVISIDPRRVYVNDPSETDHPVIELDAPGPGGRRYCWYQCTVSGGREGSDVDAVTLARACQDLGAGEILLNCIDRDGTNSGFDIALINAVKSAVTIPVIASSGAGCPDHFLEVFTKTAAESALAAGIFHRREVPIASVKQHLAGRVEIRP